jgi:hypothetical protein
MNCKNKSCFSNKQFGGMCEKLGDDCPEINKVCYHKNMLCQSDKSGQYCECAECGFKTEN